jgi:RecB family endonuclease NucS
MVRRFTKLLQAPILLEKARRYEQELRLRSRQRSVHGRSIRNPTSESLLKKAGNQWEFSSEQALEDFVWENLTNLLFLTPLKRQHTVNGERCDILALDLNGKLVVLELKNCEDRNIVQQLTRYYANLYAEKPPLPGVDYTKPIRLLALKPKFHRHNLIDKEYNKLDIEFFEYKVIKQESTFFLLLAKIGYEKAIIKVEIACDPSDVDNLTDNLPPPPVALNNIIKQCPIGRQEQILKIRERILCFHERIQEITATGVIKYGRGKTKICAELRLHKSDHLPTWYLYLPIPDRVKSRINQKQPLGRMGIYQDTSNNNLDLIGSIGYIPPGKRGASKLYKFSSYEKFMNLTDTTSKSSSIDMLVDIALENWLERL